MVKRTKFIAILFAVIIMSGTFDAQCNAAMNNSDLLTPLYTNVTTAEVTLKKSNNVILVTVYSSAASGTTYQGGILTLRRTDSSGNTVFLENLRNLSSSTAVYSYYNNSHNATSGTYIVKFAIYAVRNGVSERINLEKTLVI